MNRRILEISIVSVFFVLASWYWIEFESDSNNQIESTTRNNFEEEHADFTQNPRVFEVEKTTESWDSNVRKFVPFGRFELSRVIDKKVVRDNPHSDVVTAYFLVESGEKRKRIVFLEQIYNEEGEGELSLTNQFASVGDEIIFDANPGLVDLELFVSYLEEAGGYISRRSRLSSFVQVKLHSPSVTVYLDLLEGLRKEFPNTTISRDDLYFTSAEPTEYLPSLQWHLDQIAAPDAWEFSTRGDETVVAVIDTGCLVTHPDLVDNIFVNTNEIPNNGIDDDNNGFVDDIRGWDFLDDDANPNDETGHGTHVSGIVGARGNNGVGTVGVTWDVKVLPLKVGDDTGLSSSAIAEALRYVSSLKGDGFNVVATNNSYGSSAPNSVARAEIQVHEEIGIIFVAAAGNAGEDIDAGGNSQFPAGFPEENIISVANSTQGDDLSFGSNFGIESVDIAAPGQEVYSTYLDGEYEFLTGTSMASPIVAGAVALLATYEPELSSFDLRQRIFDTAKPFSGFEGKISTGGRLDLLAMLEPDMAGHTLSIVNHEPHLIFLPDFNLELVLEIESAINANTTLDYLGLDSSVSIQEISPQVYSVKFGSNGAYRFRIVSEKRGIVRESEKLVIVGNETIDEVKSGLLHSWNFEGNGSSLVDEAGTGNAELVGASRVDAPLGQGVDFDGTDSFARFNANFSPIVTLSAFVKSDDLLSSPHPRIINMPDYYLYFSTRGISDVPDGNANTLKFYSNRTGDFGVWNSPPDTVIEGEWTHVLASYDSRETLNTPKLYINGIEQKVRLQRIPVGEQTNAGGESYLGDREDGTRAWDGQMDEVRVFDRQIGKDEVSLIAARYASAVWNSYRIVERSSTESEGVVSLSLENVLGDKPMADFEWSLVGSPNGVSLSDFDESSVEIENPENLNTRLVLRVSNPLGVRYYLYDLVGDPPQIDSGVYTGTTTSGGTLWVEVDDEKQTGYVTIWDENSEVLRIREPISINSFGDFETDPFQAFGVTGTIDGGIVGQIEDLDLEFYGDNIEPSSVVDGYSGFYSGGVVSREEEFLDLKILDSGEVFLWRTGNHTEFLRGTVSIDGEFIFQFGDGSLISGIVDTEKGTVRGDIAIGEESMDIFLRRENLGPSSRYVNLSTRGFSNVGESVLIGGFVLSGTEPRTVLVRGIGPDLENRGVAEFLPNPLIRIFNGDQVIAENDNWSSQSNTESLIEFSNRVQASPLLAGSLDAAILLDLNPGVYTVFLDTNGGEGEGLFEVFDDPREQERSLYNASTRGRIQGAEGPLIAGFVVSGMEPKQVLIRALGPALEDRGVIEPLTDPWIELYSETVAIAANDNWSEGSSSSMNGNSIKGPARGLHNAFESAGATPLEFGSKDAAILVWLEPGLYTAIARGSESAEGIALVEVFELR